VRNSFQYKLFARDLSRDHVHAIYSETGMAQVNTVGGVAGQDPMVLTTTTRTVARFSGLRAMRAWYSSLLSSMFCEILFPWSEWSK
jgi:hypothetical protein